LANGCAKSFIGQKLSNDLYSFGNNDVLVSLAVEGINVDIQKDDSLLRSKALWRILLPKSVGNVTPQKAALFLVNTVRT
jgi:hypothetical protein